MACDPMSLSLGLGKVTLATPGVKLYIASYICMKWPIIGLYLEALENYIQFLYEQFALIGATPPPMGRLQSHAKFSSRSIRTILLHMQEKHKRLDVLKGREERRYLHIVDLVKEINETRNIHETHAEKT
ncbi:hypothetical protein CPB84DRAFT_1753919 [Gymnopilus junonius]|uniref:Uncharacterized protein n=1 Tax=Gymnopilus junonius TaxID=109634 RepID=A0A9P5NAE0_GYMJU|nr:hypothetical protein CPB84DRAFT_1753919 [Gymnopilus junonius]